MSNPISDPGLTREEAEALVRRGDADGWAVEAAEQKIRAALSAPENNSGVEKAVEVAAETLWNEREFREPTGDEPEGWCPPGHDVHQEPPHEPFLWEQMVAEGKYEGDQQEYRSDARAVVDAIRPFLTQQPVLLSDEDRK